MIPYGRQEISDSDIQSVIAVLQSEFLTQGPTVPLFEKAVAKTCQGLHGVAVNSATSALHLACLALDVGPGDRVWTSPVTFVASANCALYCGAQVDFVDINPITFNIDIACLEEKLLEAKAKGLLPKVVVVVHLGGEPCDLVSIASLADKFGFKVIEDASHAIGARYRDESIGSCRYSDLTVFSFHPVKVITTTEGGMVLTNSPQLARKVQLLRSHGITRETDEMAAQEQGDWYYEQIALGFNYRMTDVQAALGMSQVARLNEFVARRHVRAKKYDDLLSGLPVETQDRHAENYSALHLYLVRFKIAQIGVSKQELFKRLRLSGVGVNLHYIPVYLQPYYQKLGFKRGHCPQAESYFAESMTLPLYPGLTDEQQEYVVDQVKQAIA